MIKQQFDKSESNLYRMKSLSDKSDRKFDEFTEKMKETRRQRLAGFEHEARQPCLAMEADVTSDTKRAEDAAGDQTKNGDSCSAKRVDAGLASSTSFGMTAEPPALPRKDDVLVDKGAEVPKPCLSPVKMRTLTAAGGLLPAGHSLYSNENNIFPTASFLDPR